MSREAAVWQGNIIPVFDSIDKKYKDEIIIVDRTDKYIICTPAGETRLFAIRRQNDNPGKTIL